MQRALSRLSDEQFDLLIIGGGATGAFAARDAAMRGLCVALIERGDFAGATSAHNSKLAHGGLRYLRNGEFGLVRESLRERRNLMRIAPHLVRPLSFLLPVHHGIGERVLLSAGLTLYDLLAFDRNRLEDPAQHLPRHRWLGGRAVRDTEPVLESPRLSGAFAYPDAQMYAPERIALECIIAADEDGAVVANHLAAETLLLRDGRVEGARVRDTETDARFDVRAKTVLLAMGPWSDLFLEEALGKPPRHRLIRSKGIHLLTPAFTNGRALTIEAGAGHFFVLPWRGHTLIGTTDTPFQSNPDTVGVSERDIGAFLAVINKYLPAAELNRESVLFAYAGLRPLVADGSGSTYKASRRAELVDHAGEGVDGLFSALGGKWTTSRALAQTTVDALVEKLGKTAKPCATAATPLPGGRIDRFDGLLRGFQKTYPGIAAMTHLAHMYGARLPSVLRGAKVSDFSPYNASGDTPAQIAFAVREEMARTLDDVVMRRTGLGQFGKPERAVLDAVAAIMAPLLGWSDARRDNEIAHLDAPYRMDA